MCWQGTKGSQESERTEVSGREPSLALLTETLLFYYSERATNGLGECGWVYVT